MYHIAVCDDNQEEAHLIGRMTQEIMAQREIEAQVDLFFDPESLLDKLQQTQIQYDLFLLDILMEERNGIQLAQAFRQRGYRGKLIYITASRDCAIDGYKVKADDYLLKPVEKDTLDQAIGRVLPRLETVLLETTGDMKILQLQQILYVESTGHYVLIRLGDKGTLVFAGHIASGPAKAGGGKICPVSQRVSGEPGPGAGSAGEHQPDPAPWGRCHPTGAAISL